MKKFIVYCLLLIVNHLLFFLVTPPVLAQETCADGSTCPAGQHCEGDPPEFLTYHCALDGGGGGSCTITGKTCTGSNGTLNDFCVSTSLLRDYSCQAGDSRCFELDVSRSCGEVCNDGQVCPAGNVCRYIPGGGSYCEAPGGGGSPCTGGINCSGATFTGTVGQQYCAQGNTFWRCDSTGWIPTGNACTCGGGGGCTTNSQCGSGQICGTGGVCVSCSSASSNFSVCTADSQCGSGNRCGVSNSCYTCGGGGGTCSSATCPAPYSCSGNSCQTSCFDGSICVRPQTCSSTGGCSSGGGGPGPGGGGGVGTITAPAGFNLPFISGDANVFVSGLVRNGIGIMIIVAFIVALIWTMLAGFKFLLANGEPKEVSAAWSQIRYGLIGLAVILSAFAIIKLVETFFNVNIIGGGLRLPTRSSP